MEIYAKVYKHNAKLTKKNLDCPFYENCMKNPFLLEP